MHLGMNLTFCIHSVVVVTNHSCIFSMITVAHVPAAMWTRSKRVLSSRTVHLIQPYWPSLGTAKVGLSRKTNSSRVTQHTAYHMRIIYAP